MSIGNAMDQYIDCFYDDTENLQIKFQIYDGQSLYQ